MINRLVLGLLIGAVALLVGRDAAMAQQAVPRASLLTVQTDGGASCRVVDRFGGSRTREFGAPATVQLSPRDATDQIVCVRDGREARVAVPVKGPRVALAVAGSTRAASSVRRFVSAGEVHPYPGRMRLKPQTERDLVWLRQRFEEGQITEREYFDHRRLTIARDADLRPVRQASMRKASPNKPTPISLTKGS